MLCFNQKVTHIFKTLISSFFSRMNRHLNEGGDNTNIFDTLFENISSEDMDLVKTKIVELNTHLLMAHEGMKFQIKPDRFVKMLIKHLDNKIDSTLMLNASNCLLTMLDLFPETAEVMIFLDGLKVLESKGQTIEYIELAEDCIKIINKISEQCPAEVMTSN